MKDRSQTLTFLQILAALSVLAVLTTVSPALAQEATPEPTTEPTPVPTTEPTPVPTTEPTTEPTPDPTTEPTPDPTTEPTPDPTTEPTTEPTPDPTTEPTPEPTPEPTTEPTPDPTTEPTPDPTTEPTPDPTTEPTPDPTTEPTTEPTPEPTPDPTLEFDVLRMAAVSEVVTALNGYRELTGSPLVIGAGSRGRGTGFLHREGEPRYDVSISSQLAAAGLLNPESLPRDPQHTDLSTPNSRDLKLRLCNGRIGVFSTAPTITPSPEDTNWWTTNNCQEIGSRNYFQLTTDATLEFDVLRMAAVSEVVTALNGYRELTGSPLVIGAGSRGRGTGFLHREGEPRYDVSISSQLAAAGLLNPESLPRDPQHTDLSTPNSRDLKLRLCNGRIGVFSTAPTITPSPEDTNWWTTNNCQEIGSRNYFQLTTDATLEFDVLRMAAVSEVVTALNGYRELTGSPLVIGAGSRGRGTGFLHREGEPRYDVSISSQLAAAGLLNPESLPRDPQHTDLSTPNSRDLKLRLCNGRIGVFSTAPTITPSPEDTNWWTTNNCQEIGSRNYFQLTTDPTLDPVPEPCALPTAPPPPRPSPLDSAVQFEAMYTTAAHGCDTVALQVELPDGNVVGLGDGRVSSLENGEPYTFRVRAVNESGPGPWSAPSEPVTPRGTPGTPSIQVISENGRYRWSIGGGDPNGAPISGYTLAGDVTGFVTTAEAGFGNCVNSLNKPCLPPSSSIKTPHSTRSCLQRSDTVRVTGSALNEAGASSNVPRSLSLAGCPAVPSLTLKPYDGKYQATFTRPAGTDRVYLQVNSSYGSSVSGTRKVFNGTNGSTYRVTAWACNEYGCVKSATKTVRVGSNRRVTLGQGVRTAGCCDYMVATISGFKPNTTYSVIGNAVAGPYPQGADTNWCPNWRITTNSQGYGYSTNHCYYGWWGNDVKVTVDGVSSPRVDWKAAAGTAGPTPNVSGVPSSGNGSSSSRAITLTQGSRTAGCCNFMSVSIRGFAPNRTYHVVGEAVAGPYPQGADTDWCPNWTIRTNSAGSGTSSNHCYYGWWGNRVRVSVDGTTTSWVTWNADGSGSGTGGTGAPNDNSSSSGSLRVSWTENPFTCDGGVRKLGTISGFSPGEGIRYTSPDVSGLLQGTANSSGVGYMQWQCDRGTQSWELRATGITSGRTLKMTVNGRAPGGTAGGNSGTISVTWIENPFRCDGGVRPLGRLTGFLPGERVVYTSPQTGALIPGTATASGVANMQWVCDSATTWQLTATGQRSGRAKTMTVTGIAGSSSGGNGGTGATSSDFVAPFACGTKWHSSTYTSTVVGGVTYYHGKAVDFNAAPWGLEDRGTAVYASKAGTVVSVDRSGTGTVVIDHGSGWTTQYTHMQSIPSGLEWSRVTTSTRIGSVGAVGPATGPHLHYVQLKDGVQQTVRFGGSVVPVGYTYSLIDPQITSQNCADATPDPGDRACPHRPPSQHAAFREKAAAVGRTNMGCPINAVHLWGGLWVQDFDGGKWGRGILIQNPRTGKVSVVRTGFWHLYSRQGGPARFGAPLRDESAAPGGDAFQEFDYGSMSWIGGRLSATSDDNHPEIVELSLSGTDVSLVERSATESFTTAAERATDDGGIAINTNFFDGDFVTDYTAVVPISPSLINVNGLVFEGGDYRGGSVDSSSNRYYMAYEGGNWYFGEGEPCRVQSLLFGTCAHSSQRNFGLGGARKLILHTVSVDPDESSDFDSYKANDGMVVIGFSHRQDRITVFVQSDNAFNGWTLEEVQDWMEDIEVETALIWDGGSSATLVRDGDTVIDPPFYKNNMIPFGIALTPK